MRQINTSDKRFHNGNGRNEMGTIVTAEWLNAVQDELVNLVTSLGGRVDDEVPNQIATLLLDKLAAKSSKQHNHSMSDISGLSDALAAKAPLASPALTGTPTAPTASQETNNTQIATTAFVKAAIAALVGSAPAALDTLQELASALGQDANFRNTVLNQIAGKANTSHTHLYNQIADFEQGVLHYLTQGFSQNLNENGWVKFPNGLILQWGKVNRTANSKLIFPIAFPKVCLFLGFTPFFESGWSYAVTVHSRSKLTNTHANFTNQHGDAMFFAVGY